MKKLLLTLCLLTAITASAQLAIEFITPVDGQHITGKQLDVFVHLTSDDPAQVYPVHFAIWENGILFGYGDVYGPDELVGILKWRTFVKGPHVFTAEVYDDFSSAWAVPVTVYRAK